MKGDKMNETWDELIDKFEESLDSFYMHPMDKTGSSVENVSIARTALRSAISAVEQERDALAKREYELLKFISTGKKIKANVIYDFDRYETFVNVGYVDGLISGYEINRARVGAK